MADTVYAAPGHSPLEPECVTAHGGVSDVHHAHTSLIKTETDLGSTHTGDLIKTEHLDITELGCATPLHPDQIKTEADDGGYIQAEHFDLQDIKCFQIESDQVKCESRESLVCDLVNTVSGAGLGSTHIGSLKLESPDSPELGGFSHLPPDPDRNDADSGRHLKTEQGDSLDIKFVDVKTYQMGCESGENSAILLINPLINGAGERCANYKNEEIHDPQKRCGLYRVSALDKEKRILIGENCCKYMNCGKPSSLNPHKTIYKGEKPHTCFQCGKCFRDLASLNAHKIIHTGENPYECTQSEQCFAKKSTLNIHQRIHTSEKLYKCSHCEKSFKKKSNLNVHQIIHTGEKAYTCSQCGKGFTVSSSLIAHKRIHTGEKPYKCSQCEQCFTKKSTLNIHQRIHTGEKPYKCSQCEKSFKKKSTLNEHQRIHTGEKPYKCGRCGKGFASKSNLNQHLKIHEKPYNCTNCGKCFGRPSDLCRHQRIHEGEEQ